MNAFNGAGAAPPHPLPLGELLIERGLLSREQLDAALVEQEQTGRPLGEIVVARGFVVPALVAQALATQVGGLTKSEYGYATGFAPLAAAPGPVVPPPAPAPVPASNSLDAEPNAAVSEHLAEVTLADANGFAPLPAMQSAHETPAAPEPLEASAPLEHVEPATNGVPRDMDIELKVEAAARAADDHIRAYVEPDVERGAAERLRVEAVALEAGLATAQQREAALADATAELRAEVVSLETQLAAVAVELAGTREQTQLLEQQLADAVSALERQAFDTAGELDALRRERDGLVEVQQQLAQVTIERDGAQALLEDREARLAQLAHEYEQMAVELTRARDQNGAQRIPDADRHFVFVSGATGYRLVEGSGPAPAAGEMVELDDERFIVVRVGLAPLPGERVACSYVIPA